MEERESVVVGTLALGYLAVALGLAFALPSERELEPVVVLALLAASVGVSLIRFHVGAGYVCAEQLVYVPLLFFAPLPLVLLLVPVAYALSDLPDFVAGRAHRDRWMNALADSWFAIGSVTVLGLFAPGAPQLELVPVYLGALAAQVGLGTSAALAREYFVGRLSVRDELRSAAAAYQLDVMLSPIGLALAFAAAELGPVALLAILPVAGGLFWLSRFHRERCDRLVAEHEAYWRRFLRDARRLERCAKPDVSQDWQSMPEMALAVCAELRLDMDVRAGIAQAAQTAAWSGFHDPGERPDRRLRFAAALIEGRLAYAGADPLVSTPAGERLREQAELVRLSGERYDGRGAGGGPRGDDIPLGSRIIACCQAYSEFTAAAPDRAPMSGEIALEELRRDAGRRFDPDIVGALGRALRQQELGAPPAPTRSPWLLDQLRPVGPVPLGGRTGLG
ncbi:MAG TPA: HD domain-containing phosphohydrolase [Thermoleophilaceae bacterium]|nr:HD domain-containing phosphohydrolase [Thermoleophilaceae bacterium]